MMMIERGDGHFIRAIVNIFQDQQNVFFFVENIEHFNDLGETNEHFNGFEETIENFTGFGGNHHHQISSGTLSSSNNAFFLQVFLSFSVQWFDQWSKTIGQTKVMLIVIIIMMKCLISVAKF